MQEADVIPKEAIDAAAEALEKRAENDDWEWCLGDARAALEAAAPFIRAQALEDAADDFEDNMGVAEFDEWARRDGTRWNHIDEAWEHQGPYMDWLRARAVTERA